MSSSEQPSSRSPETDGVDLAVVACDTVAPPQGLPFVDDAADLTFDAVHEFLSGEVFNENLDLISKRPTLPPAALGSGDQEKYEALLREFESGDE